VLLDVQMPGMTGIELARHITARAADADGSNPRPDAARSFVTAHDEHAVEAFEVGRGRLPAQAGPPAAAAGRAAARPEGDPAEQLAAIEGLARRPTPSASTCRCTSAAA
jgi:two-component system response regulator AlgR